MPTIPGEVPSAEEQLATKGIIDQAPFSEVEPGTSFPAPDATDQVKYGGETGVRLSDMAKRVESYQIAGIPEAADQLKAAMPSAPSSETTSELPGQ